MLQTINIFSLFSGITLFCELVFVIALLKPFKEPHIIRDGIINLRKQGHFTVISFDIILLFFIITVTGIFWEILQFKSFFKSNTQVELINVFYKTVTTVHLVCFIINVFVLFLMERILKMICFIARLLEFELMCRYAMLTRELPLDSELSVENTSLE